MSVATVTQIHAENGIYAGVLFSTSGGFDNRDYNFTFTLPADLEQWDHLVFFFAIGSSRFESLGNTWAGARLIVGTVNGISTLVETNVTFLASSDTGLLSLGLASSAFVGVKILDFWNVGAQIPSGSTVAFTLRGVVGSTAAAALKDKMMVFEAYQVRYAGRLVAANKDFINPANQTLPAAASSGSGDGSGSAYPVFFAGVAWDSAGAENWTPSGGFTDLDNFTRTASGRTHQGDEGLVPNANDRSRDVALYSAWKQRLTAGTEAVSGTIGGTQNKVSPVGAIIVLGPPLAGLQPNLIRNSLEQYVLYYIDRNSQLIARHYDPSDAFTLPETTVDAGPKCSCPSFCLREAGIVGSYLLDDVGKASFSFDFGFTHTTIDIPGSWDRLYSSERNGQLICIGYRFSTSEWTFLVGDLYRDPGTGAIGINWGTEGVIVAGAGSPTGKGRVETFGDQVVLVYEDQFNVWQMRSSRDWDLGGAADFVDFSSIPGGPYTEVTVQQCRNRLIANCCVSGVRDYVGSAPTATTWHSVVGVLTDAFSISWGAAGTNFVSSIDAFPNGHVRWPEDENDLNFVWDQAADWSLRTNRALSNNAVGTWFA